MRIGIAYSLAPADACRDGPDDRFEEFDQPETIEALAGAIRGAGHEVVPLGDGRPFLERVLADPPDFVFNIAEGDGISRSREARVPAVLDMLGIPYSGSDPLTLAAALDKEVARRLVREVVSVPPGIAIPADASSEDAESRLLACFRRRDYPVILKPACEGSSKGVRARCLADDEAEAIDVFRRLARDYCQPILVEQFIDGDEATVGLVGNGEGVEVLGAMRIVPGQPTGRFVYSLEVKRDYLRRVRYEAPIRLPAGDRDRLFAVARMAYEALGCRDVARIDFRIKGGRPYFIEANPLPGLAPVRSDLVILAQGYGIGYADLIGLILRKALGRAGLARAGAAGP